MQPLNVHFLPDLIGPTNLAGGIVVIIDILRASSTIATALLNGARRVIACADPDEAMRIRDESPIGSVLLGGERRGVLIEGFDCGNSPAEYPASRVAGKTIAFTTTNGTKALLKSADAETILIGAFINRKALVARLTDDSRPIHLVCAGTDGEITGEDVLFAGAVVHALTPAAQASHWELNDSARIASAFWRLSVRDESSLEHGAAISARIEFAMRETRGGINLRDLGYDNDITLCSDVDSIGIVPILRGNALEIP